MALQTRNLHKEHAHAHYRLKQRSNCEAWAYKFRSHVFAIGCDYKATANIGELGTPVSVLSMQRKTIASVGGAETRAMDHEAGHVKVKAVPTVLLLHDEPTSEICSWYRGRVRVLMKNNIFQSSNEFGAVTEFLVNCKDDIDERPVFMCHSDGGGEHNLSFPSVQAAVASFSLQSRCDHTVFTNSCPYQSYTNEPERVMSILNIGLYGVSVARPLVDSTKFPGREGQFRTTKTITDQRRTGERFKELKEGLEEALRPVFKMIIARFEKLALKDEPFQRGEVPSEDDEAKSFEVIKRLLAAEAQAPTRSELKRKYLEANCKSKTLWESHFEADRCKIEFDKSCWRQQLRNIQANNGGALPPAAVRKCYAEFKCEFGCPPPRMSPEEFLELKPVPRPKLPAGANTGKYLTFAETFGTSAPYSAPDLKEGSTVELAPSGTMLQGNVRTMIKCNSCPHVRCVYTKQDISRLRCGQRSGLDVLKEDAIVPIRNVRTCGDTFGELGTEPDGDGTIRSLENYSLLQGTARPYVRLTVHCATPTETQLYTCLDKDCTFSDIVLNGMSTHADARLHDLETAQLLAPSK